MKYIYDNGPIVQSELSDIPRVPRNRAREVLKHLADIGLLVAEMEGNKTLYMTDIQHEKRHPTSFDEEFANLWCYLSRARKRDEIKIKEVRKNNEWTLNKMLPPTFCVDLETACYYRFTYEEQEKYLVPLELAGWIKVSKGVVCATEKAREPWNQSILFPVGTKYKFVSNTFLCKVKGKVFHRFENLEDYPHHGQSLNDLVVKFAEMYSSRGKEYLHEIVEEYFPNA